MTGFGSGGGGIKTEKQRREKYESELQNFFKEYYWINPIFFVKKSDNWVFG